MFSSHRRSAHLFPWIPSLCSNSAVVYHSTPVSRKSLSFETPTVAPAVEGSNPSTHPKIPF